MTVIVRCPDLMTFEIDPETLEPKQTQVFDAYCFINPKPGVTYIDHAVWIAEREHDRKKKDTKAQ